MGVVYQTHVLSYKYPVEELEHVKDTDKLFPLRKSLGEWVWIDRK